MPKHYVAFRSDTYLWRQVAEMSFDLFQVPVRSKAWKARLRQHEVVWQSLRQPGFSQALFPSREIFRPTKREHTPEIGNPKRRIDLA